MKFTFIIGFVFFLSHHSLANINGTDFQNFNPTVSPKDYVTVFSSETIEQGELNLSFFTNYAVNSLPFFNRPGFSSSQKIDEPNDRLLSTDLGIGVGLTGRWDIRISLPIVLSQSIDNNNNLSSFDEKGVTELKVLTKYTIYKMTDRAFAVTGGINLPRIDNNPFAGADPGPAIHVNGIYQQWLSNQLHYSVNIGYRLRDDGDAIVGSGVSPIEDQITYSAALAYQTHIDQLQIMGEIYGAHPIEEVHLPTDRDDTNLEVLIGAKYQLPQKGVLHAGLGTEVYHGLATPDIRIYAGIQWPISIGQRHQKTAAPEPTPQPKIIHDPVQTFTISDIGFATGSSKLKSSANQSISNMTGQLRSSLADIETIAIEGHCDNRGNTKLNQALSKRRANSVAIQMVSEIPELRGRIQTFGYGKTRPKESNDSDWGRSQNRRVEIKIYRKK